MIIGRLPILAPRVTESIEVRVWGIWYHLHHFSICEWKVSIPNVAENESQNPASYSGPRGLMRVRSAPVHASIASVDDFPPYSTIA
jgi:hypothetical protein